MTARKHWWFDSKNNCIVTTDKREYWIALDRCKTADEVCDWLAQIAEKAWGTPEVLGELVAELHDQLDLRRLGVDETTHFDCDNGPLALCGYDIGRRFSSEVADVDCAECLRKRIELHTAAP